MTYTFSIRLDIEEYSRVMRHIVLKTRNYVLNLALGCLMAAFGIGGLIFQPGDTFSPLLALMGFMIGGLAVYTLWVLPGIRFKQNPQFRETVALTLCDDDVRSVTPLVDTRVKWGIYSHFSVIRGFYVLFYKGAGQTIIPARALDGVTTAAEFHDFLKSRLPEKAA